MLNIAQIVVSLILIGLVLIQEKSAGTSGIFGGGGGGASYQTRRGLEKFIFWGTIIAAIIFAGLALLNLTSGSY
ncbi:MAG: preprotein translocase subunit SecG [Patescibacteria group bacterium]